MEQKAVGTQVTLVNNLGDISKCLPQWCRITHDPFVLGVVKDGIVLDLCKLPLCHNVRPPTTFNAHRSAIIDSELHLLCQKGVIQPTSLTDGAFVSTVFVTEKPDETFRMILNLKKLNECVSYVHFKMESLQNVLQIIRSGVWMGSIDLKDAYYSVRVRPDQQKYFIFYWRHAYYEYIRMPNGYAQAPLLFTKILKKPFRFLRKHGLESVVYIDDSYLQGDTYEKCLDNLLTTQRLLTELGFKINCAKSVLTPCQRIKFLGFIIDSVAMTISLSDERKLKILKFCQRFHQERRLSIREVASAVGCLIAALPGVTYGALYYRLLERAKIAALKATKPMVIPSYAFPDIEWWEKNVATATHVLHTPPWSSHILMPALKVGVVPILRRK